MAAVLVGLMDGWCLCCWRPTQPLSKGQREEETSEERDGARVWGLSLQLAVLVVEGGGRGAISIQRSSNRLVPTKGDK